MARKTDWSNWVTFFDNMAKGNIPHSSAGYYIVDKTPEWSRKKEDPNKPVIKLVTPVAQNVEQARAELQEEKAISREQTNPPSRQSTSRGQKRQLTRRVKKQVKKKKKEVKDTLTQ